MNRNRLSAVFMACTVLLTLMTPLHAENNNASGNSTSSYNNYLDGSVDQTKIYETYNDKVLMYETMTSGMARQTTPLNKTLAVNFQTQENYYYCGPAAVRMVLYATGKSYPQSFIASFIGTTSDGTGFGGTLLNAMNSHCGSSFSFNLVCGSTDLKTRTVIAINYGNPVLVNTYQPSGVDIIEGHMENNIFYHYGVINGYKRSGDVLVYTDPAYGRYPGTAKQQDISLSNMQYLCSTRGFIW